MGVRGTVNQKERGVGVGINLKEGGRDYLTFFVLFRFVFLPG